MRTMGICFGATTIQVVLLKVHSGRNIIEKTIRVTHEGNPHRALLSLLSGINSFAPDRVCVTGRSFRKNVKLSSISEPCAVECAIKHTWFGSDFPRVVISAGGETFLAYWLGVDGSIVSVHTGNKCASGTGEFFLQQIRRMDLSLEQAVAMAMCAEPHRIAGRCSVFCKSDCTHSLNKGVAKDRIVAGLCLMMAEKAAGLIDMTGEEKVALVGGGALNAAMVRFLGVRIPNIIIPDYSAVFEAFGAALWAAENECAGLPDSPELLFLETSRSFGSHPRLDSARSLVSFKTVDRGQVREGDTCIVGLDVGSTTTKAVVLRMTDKAVLASVYLRTNADPVGASRNCYRALNEQLGKTAVEIIGLGITGSGRQIAGLHALSETIINEIIAHATAASYYDPEVDTIFEIGGQDAKYTFLTNGVPSDYAMNEACSAGTGSFLEEAAKEGMNVEMEQIGDLALDAGDPPDFGDECAAFISSNIKRAVQEDIGRNEILAGLVYSICLNYLNRVKGARPAGARIFMQGGVCYNPAVPVAMASLLKTPVVVAPDPGLMGAFGVALEVLNRIERGLAAPDHFSLDELAGREAAIEGSFICGGGREKCDRKCRISRVRVNGQIYPFGGICDRYYNVRLKRDIDAGVFDLVDKRRRMILESSAPVVTRCEGRPAVGLNRAFLAHSLLPLYSHFFAELGFAVTMPDDCDTDDAARADAAFCLPALLSHSAFLALLKKRPDYIFLPHVTQLPAPHVPTFSRTCVFVQGEPYYLRTTFRREIAASGAAILSPVLKLENGYEYGEDAMVGMAQAMGVSAEKARRAFVFACGKQRAFERDCRLEGARALEYLDEHPEHYAVVLLGRPYNAFASEANMGIPHKVASHGVMIIPHEMLPVDRYDVDENMFWAMGQKIMKAARFTKKRDNLFAFYITNFSCGPDSFLLGYMREVMERKPSLTVELDQHTASAGIDTRVEAALEIMNSYYRQRRARAQVMPPSFIPARVITDGALLTVVSSEGKKCALDDPDVELVIPPMGRYGVPAVAAVLRRSGINARALPSAVPDTLLEARRNASCKECLPYLVTMGSFLSYLRAERAPQTVTLLFIPTGGGPCRLGQYARALENLIQRRQFRNVAVIALTDENGYGGLGNRLLLEAWKAIVVSDVFEDIDNMLMVTARDPLDARKKLDGAWDELIACFEGRLSVRLSALLSIISSRLSSIPLYRNPDDVPVISLIGEYYVRKDVFSRMDIVDYLQDRGFMVKVAPAMEYLLYGNHNVNTGLQEGAVRGPQRIVFRLRTQLQEWWERRIKSICASSGLYRLELVEIEKLIGCARHLVNENLRGETILTIGSGMREILCHSCGVIAIGPFGCMPSRIAEAILKREMNPAGKARIPGGEQMAKPFSSFESFPFLSIETDGKPFPQIVEANLEAFVLQARRLHGAMKVQSGRPGALTGSRSAVHARF